MRERERERERHRDGGREGEREREKDTETEGGREREREREKDVFCRDEYPNQTHESGVMSFACIHAATQYAMCPSID